MADTRHPETMSSENRDGCDVIGQAQTGTDKPAIGATRGLLRSDSNEVQRYTSLAGTSGRYSVGDRAIPVIDEIDKVILHRFKDQLYDIFWARLSNTHGHLLAVTRNQETLDLSVKKDRLTPESLRQGRGEARHARRPLR